MQVIASAYRSDNSMIQNYRANEDAIQALHALGLATVPALGSYKEDGQAVASQEVSMIIEIDTASMLDSVKNLFLERFKQDAILVIDCMNNKLARLAFSDGYELALGSFQEITESEALASECYTYTQGKFYLAKEEVQTWGDCSAATKEDESAALHDNDKPWLCNDKSCQALVEC